MKNINTKASIQCKMFCFIVGFSIYYFSINNEHTTTMCGEVKYVQMQQIWSGLLLNIVVLYIMLTLTESFETGNIFLNEFMSKIQ